MAETMDMTGESEELIQPLDMVMEPAVSAAHQERARQDRNLKACEVLRDLD